MRALRCTAWLAAELCCLVLLSGCAGKLPKTIPLGAAEEREAALLWTTFLSQERPSALDADVRLGWDVLGSKGGVSASLRIQQPALLRFAANDPLGRALYLAVADGTYFTLIDNRAGHVSQGTIHSKFWRSYVPPAVSAEDLFPLLGGFLHSGTGQGAMPSQDEQARGFWYQWQVDQNLRHHVLLDRGSGSMHQHLLRDATNGETVLEVQYSEYRKDAKTGFVWPDHLRITGAAITGTLTLRMEQIYSYAPQEKAAYQLVPPPHFTVEQVP